MGGAASVLDNHEGGHNLHHDGGHDQHEYFHADHFRLFSTEVNKYALGDIVTVKYGESHVEGLVVEIIGADRIRVDCGDVSMVINTSDCEFLKGGNELEEGDKVEMKTEGSFLYFVGYVRDFNEDGTVNIIMEGEDGEEQDVELNVPKEHIRKIESRRLKAQFKKSGWAIVALNTFSMKKSMKISADMLKDEEEDPDLATEEKKELS